MRTQTLTLPWPPTAPGTYRIVDTQAGAFYIGSAASLCKRWQQHRYSLSRGDHPNQRLQNLWNSGPDRLRFEVISEMPDATVQERLAAEQNLLDAAGVGANRQCINVLTIAGSHQGRKRSAETCQKLSAAMKGRTFSESARQLMREAKLGKPLSVEHRRKIGMAGTGRPGPRPTAQTLACRAYSLLQVSLFREDISKGLPVTHAAKARGISRSAGRRIAKGESYVIA